MLPDDLQSAIDAEIARTPLSKLVGCSEELSAHYRTSKPQSFMPTEGHRNAYLAARLPATYAAIEHVLLEVRKRFPAFSPISLLDVGAGPGTGMWAAKHVFPSLETITLLEKDASLIALGKRLAQLAESVEVKRSVWRQVDLSQAWEVDAHDLVLLSYCIGEIDEKHWNALLEKLCRAAKHVLVIIEPGTPLGFERIRTIRERLIAAKLHMIAPCPHVKACPMEKNDWCHFAERVSRSSAHRKTKDATLNYEDEKFSYIAMGKETGSSISSRVLRRPEKHSGHVRLTLCTPNDGIQKETVTRKDKERYRRARDVAWGDEFL